MTESVMRGTLDPGPLLEALSVLAQNRRSGLLTLRSTMDEVHILFDHGSVRSVSTSDDELRIGQILMHLGHVTEEQIEQALALQLIASDPDRIGEVLVDVGFISEVEISQAIAQQIQSALVKLLRDKAGVFEFVPQEPSRRPSQTSKISFEPLVLNATYLADRWLAEQEPEDIESLPETLIDPHVLQRLRPNERELFEKLLDTYRHLHQLAWRYGEAAQQVKLSVERLLHYVLVRSLFDDEDEADLEHQSMVEHLVYLVDQSTDLWTLTDLTRNARQILLHLLNGETGLNDLEDAIREHTTTPERAVQELVSAGLIRIDLVVTDVEPEERHASPPDNEAAMNGLAW